MLSAVKRRRCSSLKNIDMEQQQQSLFDASIIKLQHEQLRHGVEPRLLRFVLINNALRSLQGHMLRVDDEESLLGLGGSFQCKSSDIFFYNTFKNGSLSSIQLCPPTPVKVMKLDTGFGDRSPLVIEFQEASPSSSHDILSSHDVLTSTDEKRVHPAACLEEVDCETNGNAGIENEESGGEIEDGESEGDKTLQNGFSETHSVHLGKRGRDWCPADDHAMGGGGGVTGPRESSRCRLLEFKDVGQCSGSGGSSSGDSAEAKKLCKPSSLFINSTVQKVQNGLNGFTGLNGFLDLDPFPSLPFPLSPPSPSSTAPSSPHSPLPHHHHTTTHYSPSSSDENDKDSLTPSPIDFTNVDPSLYDFDTAVLQVETADVSTLSSQETSSLPTTTRTVAMSHMTAASGHVTVAQSHVTATSSHVTVAPSDVAVSSNHVGALMPDTTLSSVSESSLSVTSPQSSPLPSPISLPSSTDPPTLQQQQQQQQQQQLLGDTPTSSEPNISPPRSEPEKKSVVSADSMVLTAVSAGSSASSAHGGSCTMEAIVRAQNGELGLVEGGRLSHDGESISHEGNGRVLPDSPNHSIELDYMDEIDHIVNLLMT